MKKNDNYNIKVLCGDIEKAREARALRPFSEEVTEFLVSLSEEIFKDKQAKHYSDIITFGFFCRGKNIEALKKQYNLESRLGLGLIYHIAPGNVPMNFAYSLVAGLLGGNASIIKLSSKEFEQTEIMVRLIKKVMESVELKGEYVTLVKYSAENKEATNHLSEICDARMIWGGDETIKKIRKSELGPRSFDILFANRNSVAVIEAKEITKNQNLGKQESIAGLVRLARDFYNDTYLYDQNACSSPRIIYWVGSDREIEEAKVLFWNAIHQEVANRYQLEAVISVNKYVNVCRAAIEIDNITAERGPDNLITRMAVGELDSRLFRYNMAGGSFVEYSSSGIEDLEKIAGKDLQTIGYYASKNIVEEIKRMIIEKGVRGIDRIVPIGETSSFSLVWDGIDLILRLSRIITSVS
ncbi:MAG: hypothetical protein ATN31_02425 [Candidatus Epulonipiscioides saccharophilum]|nr:MAG: hypothetical protein ATN31_02425 [Epulopiscium sp. AS2M-Bin001]